MIDKIIKSIPSLRLIITISSFYIDLLIIIILSTKHSSSIILWMQLNSSNLSLFRSLSLDRFYPY